jgi:hypothetical protein
MKHNFTLILFAALVGLASCGSGGEKITNILALPVADSVSKGSEFQITFNNTGTDSETFNMYDLTENNSPVHAMSATVIMNPQDSFWTANIEVTDYLAKQVSLNLNVVRDSTFSYGVYNVIANNSTLTDYSLGQNRVYAVTTGSTVTLTLVSPSVITGTFNFNLLYNYQFNTATGSFTIYH